MIFQVVDDEENGNFENNEITRLNLIAAIKASNYFVEVFKIYIMPTNIYHWNSGKTKYTNEEKESKAKEAIRMMEEGMKITEIEKLLKIPRNTLKDWIAKYQAEESKREAEESKWQEDKKEGK